MIFVEIWRFNDFKDVGRRHLEFYGSENRFFVKPIALNCLVFEKIAFLYTHFGDRQTDGQHHRVKSPPLWLRRLTNNLNDNDDDDYDDDDNDDNCDYDYNEIDDTMTTVCVNKYFYFRIYSGSAELRECDISSQHMLPSKRSAILLLHRRLAVELG